ncbi:NAD(P)-binding protein [Wallemia mellicola]|nr:NAD(P)-binding protein [Wallemia mellicola]TIC06954.1 NAD(P)-binding protein [Wallemia mellicola]TIC72127.1 NAD(P)-binding protein [Wallemia mellicola]
MLVLTKSDVSKVIDESLNTDDLIDNQRNALISFSKGNVQNPLRSTIKSGNHNLLYMPSSVDHQAIGMKVVAVPLQTASVKVKSDGLPGATIVHDESTGLVEGLVNATELTALRTASSSLLGTSLFVPKSANPRKMVIFSTGKQAYNHAALFYRFYKESIDEITYWNHSSTSLDILNSSMFDFVDTEIIQSVIASSEGKRVDEKLSTADIVICCTPSLVPLFSSDKVKEGAHITLIGSYKPEMQEIDTQLIHDAGDSIIVDSRSDCAEEAGEFIRAGTDLSKVHTLGDLLQDGSSYLKRNGRVSIYKGVGIGIQDSSIARLILDKAKRNDIGTHIDFN